jgi:hypothetical protein
VNPAGQPGGKGSPVLARTKVKVDRGKVANVSHAAACT